MRIAVIGLVLLVSCKFVPHSGNDVYTDKADLAVDEAPHVKNSLEWWYYTGHLEDVETGNEYGVEFVFFHFNPRNKKDYMMVNFAVTDSANQKFYYDYKITSLDELLTAELPINLGYKDKKEHYSLNGQMGEYQLKGQMEEHNISVDLTTSPNKEVVLHSGTGYENYGGYATAGYYSYPRLATSGTLSLDGKTMKVKGDLWYDRQWNCIGVWQKEVAWDWFSVQFEETNEELMVYRVYHVGDQATIYGGTFYKADGSAIDLKKEEIVLTELEYWKGKKSKVEYPVKWGLEIPSLQMGLELEAVLPEQELSLKFTPIHFLHYWEGMCTVNGTLEGNSVTGNSYIELTNRAIVND